MKVWLAVYHNNEMYDEYYERILGMFSTKEKAERYASMYKEKYTEEFRWMETIDIEAWEVDEHVEEM